MPHWRWAVVLTLVLGVGGALVSMRIHRERRALPSTPHVVRQTPAEKMREYLFAQVQPVVLTNCDLQRFGEPNDGGYLMCGNLLGGVQSGYSYGISGYDGWGCQISRTMKVPVHQYDCFDLKRPACPDGRTIFHPECIGDTPAVIEGRPFDTLEHQIAINGDAAKRLVVKMDVEGAEWDAFLQTPPAVFDRIDQMAVEFHGVSEERFMYAILRLKDFFYVAHLHFNNFSCKTGLEPFPAEAYEVLFVSKRLGVVDERGTVGQPHRADAPNSPKQKDCQKTSGVNTRCP